MVKICVSGSKGKMGARLIALARDDKDLEVSGQFDMGDDAVQPIKASDCLIEFTTPQATLEHLSLCVKNKKAMVIGTTGLSDDEKEKVREASKKIPIVFSPNMSVGVNLLFKMVADASKALGNEYSIGIIEAHHVAKKDAPSGTAKELARIAREHKKDIDIPIESVREGEVVGEHTITFESPYDVMEITHSAKSRDIFVKGALEAAKFIAGKEPGLYSMKQVLGL